MNSQLQTDSSAVKPEPYIANNSGAVFDGHRGSKEISENYPRVLLKRITDSARPMMSNTLGKSRSAVLIEKFKLKYLSRSASVSRNQSALENRRALAQLSRFMHETMDAVETSLAKNSIYIRQLGCSYRGLVKPAKIIRYCEEFEIEQRDAYLNLIQDDRRSRILACFHFGDYVYGMNTLTCLDTPDRKRYVLSQSTVNAEYFENLKNALGERAIDRSSELVCAQTNSSDLSRLLRKGNSTLVLFCDLPSGFGERVEVTFLNRIASFPAGPALLAIVNRVPMLPVINYNDGGRNRITLGMQIEPCLNCDESVQEGVSRITQELADFFEPFFRKYPEQWRYLQNLPSYYLSQ